MPFPFGSTHSTSSYTCSSYTNMALLRGFTFKSFFIGILVSSSSRWWFYHKFLCWFAFRWCFRYFGNRYTSISDYKIFLATSKHNTSVDILIFHTYRKSASMHSKTATIITRYSGRATFIAVNFFIFIRYVARVFRKNESNVVRVYVVYYVVWTCFDFDVRVLCFGEIDFGF